MAVLIRRALLIVNPAARRARRVRARAERAFADAGVALDVRETERPGHAGELVTTLVPSGGYDAVFALGGDGTAMEAAGALFRSEVPLGVLAGGTGNLLARAIGIPVSPVRGVRALLGGERRQIDLGLISSQGHPPRYFAIAAGIGIDSVMVARTPGWMKRRLGIWAYTLVAAHHATMAVLRRRLIRVRVTVDGEVIEREAALAMVANFGAVVNDRIAFGPGIQTDDGVLDACVYSPASFRDALGIMWRLLRKDFRSDARVSYRGGSRIRVEAEPAHRVQADGELLGMTPFEVEVRPLGVTLLVPRR